MMFDVALEVLRAAVLLGVILFLWRAGRDRSGPRQRSWGLIVAGFGLLLFGSLLDISDNFETT
ncbi:MAG: hypothetical protein OES41_16270, partial [Rhodospirillales bacterium]|nr:hypothetical protein [Rhodospirillales bacterium]